MGLTLLSTAPSSAIHLIYYVQTEGLKIDNVVVVHEDDMQYDVLERYSEKNDFETHYVDDPNGERCETVLTELEPEILLLMVSTIIEEQILKIPETVVNTHSGILPEYRGVDSRRWAILEGGPVGVSVHLVDAGVDTGPILKTSELSLRSEDTVASIAERNYYMNKWQTLTETLIEFRHGEIVPNPQSPEDGNQYFWMHEKLRNVVDDILEHDSHPDLQ